jgi:hypothetical protein
MKALAPALLLTAALVAPSLASADGRRGPSRGHRPPAHGYYEHRPSHGYPGRYYRAPRPYYRPYRYSRAPHYGYGYAPYYGYGGYGYGGYGYGYGYYPPPPPPPRNYPPRPRVGVGFWFGF